METSFLRRALQRSSSIQRLESRSQRTKETAVLLGHRSNGWLRIDGETAILMAGAQRAEKKSPVRSLCLCNPKAYVTIKDGRRLVSYNRSASTILSKPMGRQPSAWPEISEQKSHECEV